MYATYALRVPPHAAAKAWDAQTKLAYKPPPDIFPKCTAPAIYNDAPNMLAQGAFGLTVA